MTHTVFPITRSLGIGWFQCWLIQQLRTRAHFLFLPFHPNYIGLSPWTRVVCCNFRETPEYPTEEEGLFFPHVSLSWTFGLEGRKSKPRQIDLPTSHSWFETVTCGWGPGQEWEWLVWGFTSPLTPSNRGFSLFWNTLVSHDRVSSRELTGNRFTTGRPGNPWTSKSQWNQKTGSCFL